MSTKRDCTPVHSWILAGTCPNCHFPIVRGRTVATLSPEDQAARRWDIPAMMATLDDPNRESRLYLMGQVRCGLLAAEEALPLLRKGLADEDSNVRGEATTAVHLLGAAISTVVRERLADRVVLAPDDLAARGLLLGYYSGRVFDFESERPIQHRHVLWIVAHAPESDLAGDPLCELNSRIDREPYAQAKEHWLRHVAGNPSNTRILGNAAAFFLLQDKKLCEELLNRCQALEPDEPYWMEKLGRLHQLERISAPSEETRRESGVKALAELERARGLTSDVKDRFGQLEGLAEASFTAERNDKARNYALEMVNIATRPEFSHVAGAAIHKGNIILGLLALREGSLEDAKSHLIAAGKTPGSAPLRSFGPNMQLAKELLERGERETVLEYLRLCSVFWQTDDQRIDQWIFTVKKGGMPEFGPNLVY